MRVFLMCGLGLAMAGLSACSQQGKEPAKAAAVVVPQAVEASADLIGFDLNDYPGDDAMARMKKRFAYTGYWLTAPPGENTHTWMGKRALLRGMGYGFLVLANGRMERQIKASSLAPGDLGIQDATKAIAAARVEGFPERTIIFLDQEEGGRLTAAQSAYLFGWTEAVASTGVSARGVCEWAGSERWARGDDYDDPGYSGACGKGASASGGGVGIPGCMRAEGAIDGMHDDTSGAGDEWDAGCGGVAVCSVATAAGVDAELRGHVSAGWELHGAGGADDVDRYKRGRIPGPQRRALGSAAHPDPRVSRVGEVDARSRGWARDELPVVHLDRLYWQAGWKETERGLFMEALGRAPAKPSWILDGTCGGTLELRLRSADAAILLDFPRWLCIARALRRIATGFGRTRPDRRKGARSA